MTECDSSYHGMIQQQTSKGGTGSLRQASMLGFIMLLLSGIGCHSPTKKVARQEHNLRQQWQTNLQHQANLPERVLNWDEAKRIMLEHNLKIRTARTELTNAQENVRQVYKDLIPTLNLRSGVSKRITDINALSPDDVHFSADSFFSIPGLVSTGSRWYAAKLYEFRAQAAYELAQREQMIELFRLFYSAEEFRDEKERLEMQRATASAMAQVDPFTGRLMMTEMQSRELALRREAKSLQDRAGEVLGSREFRWVFQSTGLPDLRYHENPLPLHDTNRVAQLQLRLLAVELEAARAQLLGLKLRYWPELNLFVSGPPIYQIRAGRDRFWDADELRASADLLWNIDTRGNLSRSIRQIKRQQDLQRERYRQESITLQGRLLFTQDLIKSVEEQLNRVEAQLELLLAVPPAQNYLSIQRYAYDYRTLTQQQLQLKRELSELNALFWFVDENAWRRENDAIQSEG